MEVGFSRYKHEELSTTAERAIMAGRQNGELPKGMRVPPVTLVTAEPRTSDRPQISQERVNDVDLSPKLHLRRHRQTTGVCVNFSGWKHGKKGTT